VLHFFNSHAIIPDKKIVGRPGNSNEKSRFRMIKIVKIMHELKRDL
jgi:hypothetical protein